MCVVRKLMVRIGFPIAFLANWGMMTLITFGIIVGGVQLFLKNFFLFCMMYVLLLLFCGANRLLGG